jgi:tripartite-type tricarboxylate transporter receptor subunit TctC
MRKAIAGCRITLLAVALTVSAARAQDYPNKPIRIILPNAGGGIDTTARIIAQKLGDALGQPIIIEYRPGASGTVSGQVVARAAADGYTLLFYVDDMFTIPALLPQMNFDARQELLPVASVSSNPLVVVANAAAPFSNVKEMLEAARASPDGLTYALPGTGSVNRIVGEAIALEAHIKLAPVPYRGGTEALFGLASGVVPLAIVSASAVYPGLVNTGKIKVVALTAERRPAFLPSSWPTLAESGLPIDVALLVGLFAPVGTPDAVVSRLDQAVGQALQDDAVRKRMNDAGMNPEHIGPAAFAERIGSDAARYNEIIRQRGIHLEQ